MSESKDDKINLEADINNKKEEDINNKKEEDINYKKEEDINYKKEEDINNKKEVKVNNDIKEVKDNNKKVSSFLTSTITKKDEDVPLGSEDNELKSLQDKFIESNLKDLVLFKSKCKLYIYNKEKNKFDERGIGDIMINKEKDSELIKVVMIRESIMRFGCNHYINPRHKLMKNNNVSNGWMWVTTEDTVDDEEDIKKKMYLVKFDENELTDKFKEEYEKGMKNNKEILEK